MYSGLGAIIIKGRLSLYEILSKTREFPWSRAASFSFTKESSFQLIRHVGDNVISLNKKAAFRHSRKLSESKAV